MAELQLWAQQGPAITLYAVVEDRAGKPVAGLQASDFKLFDNKAARPITSFRAFNSTDAAAHTEVVLLIDDVNDSFSNVAYERSQLERFLKANDGKLAVPMSLIFFTDAGASVQPQPSTDGRALAALLEKQNTPQHIIRRSQGIYGAADRIQLSLRTLEQLADYEAGRPGRKLVIWISPAWPLFTGPRIELTNKDQNQLFATVVRLSAKLRIASITLDSVDPLGTADSGTLRTSYYKEFVKGVRRAPDVQFGNLGLQVLAYQSGGRVLNSNNNVAGEIAACVSDLSAVYALTFQSAKADGPDDYHALDVKVDKPGLTVRTRTGYYAQPMPGR